MPSHYLNQCWNIVNWTVRNNRWWSFNPNSCIFIQENAFEKVVCKVVTILRDPNMLKPIILYIQYHGAWWSGDVVSGDTSSETWKKLRLIFPAIIKSNHLIYSWYCSGGIMHPQNTKLVLKSRIYGWIEHYFQYHDKFRSNYIDYFLEVISIANTQIQLRPIQASGLASPSGFQSVQKLKGACFNVAITPGHAFCTNYFILELFCFPF